MQQGDIVAEPALECSHDYLNRRWGGQQPIFS